MSASGAWEVLGITETRDTRAIKRAYAAALKTRRPDQDPVGFQLLTDAFEWACAWAGRHVDEAAPAPADATPAPAADGTLPELGRPVAEPPAVESAAAAIVAPAAATDPATTGSQDAATAAPDDHFDFAPFFAALSEHLKVRDPAPLARWLDAHPALYSLELKWALIPHVFDALARHAPELNPNPRHVEALQRFFGIDARLRRHPALAPALDYLESRVWREAPPAEPSKPLPAGWEDLSQVMDGERERQRPRTSGSEFPWQVVVYVLMLVFAALLPILRRL